MGEHISSRRAFLGGAAVAGGAVWIAPAITSVDAAAAATCLTPSFLGAQQALADGDAGGTATRSMTVSGIPTSGTNVVHLAFGVVDHIAGALPSTFATPAGWTLLGSYESDATTAALGPPLPINVTGSTTNWSDPVFVWIRTDPLASTYTFDVTFTGTGGFTPQARLVVAAFTNVKRVITPGGQISMQGSGVVDPTSPPANWPTNVPAITTGTGVSLVVGFTGAGNVSLDNMLLAPPGGYTLDASTSFNTGGAGYPPLWLYTLLVSGTAGAAGGTGLITPGAPNVGGQLALGC